MGLISDRTKVTFNAQMLKHLPAMQETWVRSLAWEDPPGEGDGNPLQYSCLENPMDGEPGGLQSTGSRSRRRLSDFTYSLSLYMKARPLPQHLFPFLAQTWPSSSIHYLEEWSHYPWPVLKSSQYSLYLTLLLLPNSVTLQSFARPTFLNCKNDHVTRYFKQNPF